MKQHIENLLQIAIKELQEAGELPAIPAFIQVDVPKDKQHGDFASNVAFILAKLTQKKPKAIAERIVQTLPESAFLLKVEIATRGFINFFLSPHVFHGIVAKIFAEKENFGRCKMGRGKRILVEFLSSNPTGPLHVGHGRHAAFGAVIANLLDAMGFKAYREYYVNDAGRQVDILALSVWLRYLILCGESIVFPTNGYQGEYINEIAKIMLQQYRTDFWVASADIFKNLPQDEPRGGDKEIHVDAMLERAKTLLGVDKYSAIFKLSLENILADIREDLTEFRVQFDNWFSEREFISTDTVDRMLENLQENGHVYKRHGALWFRSTHFGDEKDRVLIRSNGQRTYFVNDLAYHLNKFERGFDIAIDIFGSDHHGYVPRMKAAMQASNINPERLVHLLVQFVTLYRGNEQLSMSARSGNFVTLRELRHEVGNDAARFFYVMRKCEHHMDFDLDLAKVQSNENPLYYIQYAYARICSVFKQLAERQINFDEVNGLAHLNRLAEDHEHQLLNTLSRYPDIIIHATLHYEPSQLTNYLRDLASDFHAYYNSHQFLVDDAALRNARLALIAATKQTLLNGFDLLGITATESM